MQFLTIVKTILSLLPLIIQAISTIESAIPAGSNGASKLEAIKGILQASYSAANDAAGQFETLWPAISGTVSTLVKLFNTTGLFKSSPPVA